MTSSPRPRCHWVSSDPLYIAYHDEEWGVPCFDESKLFEKLMLEGMQAGLSWITVLKKREHYREVFHQFNPEKMASMTDQDLAKCLQDSGLIRNRLKMNALRTNAITYLKFRNSGHSFTEFFWEPFKQKPLQTHRIHHSEIPAQTETSQTLSKTLKKQGFTFVGPTIVYAFLQSMGMINDHTIGCFRHPQLLD